MDLDLYNDTYDMFCNLVEKQHPLVFEIGCGPGNITRYLLNKRPDFQIYAIDVAPAMIELAKQNNPTAAFQVMDARDLGSIDKTYEGIIAGFCTPYLSLDDLSKLIKKCAGLLSDGGIFYLSTIKGDYEKSGYATGSTGDQCFMYYYDENQLEQLFREHHFEIAELVIKDYPRADGSVEVHMMFIVRKQEATG